MSKSTAAKISRNSTVHRCGAACPPLAGRSQRLSASHRGPWYQSGRADRRRRGQPEALGRESDDAVAPGCRACELRGDIEAEDDELRGDQCGCLCEEHRLIGVLHRRGGVRNVDRRGKRLGDAVDDFDDRGLGHRPLTRCGFGVGAGDGDLDGRGNLAAILQRTEVDAGLNQRGVDRNRDLRIEQIDGSPRCGCGNALVATVTSICDADGGWSGGVSSDMHSFVFLAEPLISRCSTGGRVVVVVQPLSWSSVQPLSWSWVVVVVGALVVVVVGALVVVVVGASVVVVGASVVVVGASVVVVVGAAVVVVVGAAVVVVVVWPSTVVVVVVVRRPLSWWSAPRSSWWSAPRSSWWSAPRSSWWFPRPRRHRS